MLVPASLSLVPFPNIVTLSLLIFGEWMLYFFKLSIEKYVKNILCMVYSNPDICHIPEMFDIRSSVRECTSGFLIQYAPRLQAYSG